MARSNEMAEDAPDPLPDIGEIRPTRTDQGAAGDSTTVTRLLGSTDPAFAPGRPAPNPAAFTASAAIAATAHALALLAIISVPPSLSGRGGESVDSISVSIISAQALESRQPSTAAAGATPESVAPQEGDSETSSRAAPDQPKEDVQAKKPEPTPPVEAEKELAAAPTAPEEPAPETVPDAQAAPIIAAPPKPVLEPKVAMVDPSKEPPLPEKREEKPKEEKPEKAAPTAPEETTTAGGAQSRGVAPDLPPASSAASASPGEVRAYGLAVQEALLAVDLREAQARTSAVRVRGTVLVGLTISADGTIERADIQRSSGHRSLDEAAIQLVRLTAIPRPPASLAANQRIYNVPIVFR